MLTAISMKTPSRISAVLSINPVSLSAISGPAGRSRVVSVGADSTLAFKPVRLGRDLGGEVEVLDGLAVGDRVVLAPNALLQDGARVAVKASPAAKP